MVFAVLLALFPAGNVWAQQMKPPTPNQTYDSDKIIPNEQKVFDQLPRDIQDEILLEADRVFNNCSINLIMSKYQDCECMALKYIDARVRVGPDRKYDDVINDVARECPNVAGIAGSIYVECFDIPDIYVLSDKEQQEFCACYANETANNYTRNPFNSYRYQMNIRKGALLHCGFLDIQNKVISVRRKLDSSTYTEAPDRYRPE